MEGDVNFIVSEFVEGVTLRKYFNQVPSQLAEFLDVSIQISNALAAAHEVKIIHRDIKPENIMIRPDGYAKILDFGLAKLIEQKANGFEDVSAQQLQTAQGIILGTIEYMSPEQAQGKAVDGRTDIFSFGIVLYEILSGKRPFTGDSMGDVFAAILKTEPESLTRFGIPKELSRIVNKALQKNVDERYQHIKDLLIDLRNFKQSSEFEEKLKLQSLKIYRLLLMRFIKIQMRKHSFSKLIRWQKQVKNRQRQTLPYLRLPNIRRFCDVFRAAPHHYLRRCFDNSDVRNPDLFTALAAGPRCVAG